MTTAREALGTQGIANLRKMLLALIERTGAAAPPGAKELALKETNILCDMALRSSVQEEPAARAAELLREAQKRVSRKWRGHQFDALWLEINDYLNASTLPQSARNDTQRSDEDKTRRET